MIWLKKFMVGRYGGDQLSIYLLVLSLVLTVIGYAGIPYFIMIGTIPLTVAFYRIMSKDVKKRSLENYKFAIWISPVYVKLKKAQKRMKDSKTHKYLTCGNCKTRLRVPKGKGKIIVTCPSCKTKFPSKT